MAAALQGGEPRREGYRKREKSRPTAFPRPLACVSELAGSALARERGCGSWRVAQEGKTLIVARGHNGSLAHKLARSLARALTHTRHT